MDIYFCALFVCLDIPQGDFTRGIAPVYRQCFPELLVSSMGFTLPLVFLLVVVNEVV